MIGQSWKTYLNGAVLLFWQEYLDDPIKVIVKVFLSPKSLVEPLDLVMSQASIIGVLIGIDHRW